MITVVLMLLWCIAVSEVDNEQDGNKYAENVVKFVIKKKDKKVVLNDKDNHKDSDHDDGEDNDDKIEGECFLDMNDVIC